MVWDINNAGQIAGHVQHGEGVLLTPFVLGDMNCDEAVDEHDIGALLLLLIDPDEYEQTYPDCPGQWAGDVNQDATVNMRDWAALLRFLGRPLPGRPARDVGPQALPPAP